MNGITKDIKSFPHKIVDASGNTIPILGIINVEITTLDGPITESMVVHKKDGGLKVEVLLGMNILKYATINFPKEEIHFNVKSLTQRAEKNEYNLEITSRTLKNLRNNGGRNTDKKLRQLKAATREGNDRFGSAQPEPAGRRPLMECKVERKEDDSHIPFYNLHLKETVILPPNTVTITSMGTPKQMKENQCLHVLHNELRNGVVLPHVVTKVKDNYITIKIINLNNEEVILRSGTKISEAEEVVIIEENQDTIAEHKEKDHEENVLRLNARNDEPTVLRELTKEDIQCGDTAMTGEVVNLMNKYRQACWLEGEPLGKYTGDPLEIKLKENVVVNKPTYRIPHAQQEKLDTVISGMLKDGIISKSKSDYNSPLILVPKPDKTWRICIDYRALNEKIIPVSFPIPRIADLLSNTGQTTVISSLDLASAYHQTEVLSTDRMKTAFTVRNTRYEWNRVPFGIQSAPGFFSRVINETLYDLLGPEVLAYMDDILVFGKDNKQHLERLEDVFKRLSEVNIKVKLIKCKFFVDEVKFLGYQVTKQGMKMNNERIDAINNMPHPTNKKQLQAFLGVVNYYRRFVRNFAQTAAPLYALLKKDVRFNWGNEQKIALEALKVKLTQSPIVKFPDFKKEFHIHTDASRQGLGAVLMQESRGILHPLEYISRSINEAQKSYATTKLEALALVWALEQFRTIILHFPVHVYTDHLPLKGIVKKPTKDACLTRWALLIQEYDINLHYLPGKENLFADALSRLAPIEEGCNKIEEEFQEKLLERTHQCNNLRGNIPEKVPWDEAELKKTQLADSKCIEIKDILLSDSTCQLPKNMTKFRIINGVVYVLRTIKRGKQEDQFLVPYVPEQLMKKAFQVIHEETTAGHRGYERTMHTFTKNFYNYKESTTIKQMCNDCELCIRAKAVAKLVPIEKYPIPERPFQTISSDILGPLPVTEQGNQYILVVRDYTTRYTVLSALKHKSADDIINAWRFTISNYGSSEILITDNAQEYISEKLRNFCKFYNTRKVEISPYHASSQGLSERVNREINKLLRIYTTTHATKNYWDDLLPVLQLTINNTFNSTIKETPFYALYGYDSFTETLQSPKLNYDESDLAQRMQRITSIRRHCREKLLEAQGKYTEYANKGRSPKEIKIGQRVFAKLAKFKQHNKLDLPISGPFKVVGKQGKAYQLQEITTKKTWKVHPDYIIGNRTGLAEKTEEDEEPDDHPDEASENKARQQRYNLRPRS